ncbi:MAG TPA: hypothetical protein VKQ32_25830 [Polyangia bacterium]|nr:hypothetical protein [Polyangia bacterium]
MGREGFGSLLAWFAIGAAGVVLVACSSHGGSTGTGGAGGSAAGSGGSGAAGSGGSGAAGSGGASATGGGSSGADAGTDSGVLDGGLPASAVCTPAVGSGPGSSNFIDCNNDGTTFGVPNGAAVFGETYVLPSPLVANADNAFSFQLTGWGPYNFELWGTNTPCMAEELLWWGPFGAGTQCAQFRPTKAYTNILFVNRQMYSSSYSFATPSAQMCPGGTCPMGTTGSGKLSPTPLIAPVGDYEFDTMDRLAGGLDMTFGRTARLTVAYLAAKPDGQASSIAAGVFRLPATDPYGDAWYCIGAGSTVTLVVDKSGFLTNVQLSLRGITRLGACGDTPGSQSLSAAIYPSTTSGTYFAADISGTVTSWNGTNLATSPYCSGSCNFRFRGSPQQHYVHVATASGSLGSGTVGPDPVTAATWLVQADSTQPFSMACSSEGTLNYTLNDNSSLQLTNVTGPLSCPGTAISNNQVDITVDR